MEQSELAASHRLLRAASGQAAAVPPTSVMNSRRRISVPKLRRQDCIRWNGR
jgi:hypothetical protein